MSRMTREEVGSEYLRFLRIKHKVVQRLVKEVVYYQSEVKQHEATVSRMKYAIDCYRDKVQAETAIVPFIRDEELRAHATYQGRKYSQSSVLQAENREPSDIKQQQNVLDETVLMVPDAESRLVRACAELDDYIYSNRVCAAAARSCMRSGAAALAQERQQRQQQQQQPQQQQEQQHPEAGGAASGEAAVAANAAAGSTESCQQPRGSSGSAAAQQASQSSSTGCTTQQKQSSDRVNAKKGTKADGGADRQKQQLNEEIYEEVQKIFDTISGIERDLPHLHVSLGAADRETAAGANAAENIEDEDI